MQVKYLLDSRQIDYAELSHFGNVIRIIQTGLLHGLAGTLYRSANSGFPDKHMMCFFGQHEATGSRQWVEPRLSLGFQLHFAITINEKREHEERQPIRCLLVKCTQHTRSVRIT